MVISEMDCDPDLAAILGLGRGADKRLFFSIMVRNIHLLQVALCRLNRGRRVAVVTRTAGQNIPLKYCLSQLFRTV